MANFVWVFQLFIVLTCFATAQYFPVMAIVGTMLSIVMFFVPFFGDRQHLQDRLLVSAVSFAIVITAFYPPFLGMFSSIEGGVNGFFVKLFLGLRSAFFATWVGVAFVLIVIYRHLRYGYAKLFALFFILLVGALNGALSLEAQITYFLNAFLPLFVTILIIPYLIENGQNFERHAKYAEKLLVLSAIISLIYFPILMMNLDIFRPDLALMHQTIEGRGLNSALPPQWQSYINGEFFPRFVGTFPNPILLGYFCAISSFVFFIRERNLISILFAILTVATLSKGAILFLLVAHLLRLSLIRSLLLFWLALILVVAGSLTLAYFLDGSNRVHLRGLTGGVQSVLTASPVNFLFGFGIGSGGNLARSQLEDGPVSAGWLASGSESGIGVLIYQLGFVGIAFLAFICSAIYHAATVNKSHASTNATSVVALCAAWFANMLLQEDLINVTISSQMLLAVIMLSAFDGKASNQVKHFSTQFPSRKQFLQ